MSELALTLEERSLFVSYDHDADDDTYGFTVNGVIVRPTGLAIHDLTVTLTCRDERGRVLYRGDLYMEDLFEGDELEFSSVEWVPAAIFTRTVRVDLVASARVRLGSSRIKLSLDQIEALPSGGS